MKKRSRQTQGALEQQDIEGFAICVHLLTNTRDHSICSTARDAEVHQFGMPTLMCIGSREFRDSADYSN